MTKNPFEIRADVLELAKEYMDKQVQMNIDYTKKMQELGQASFNELATAYKPYTFDELMAKAKEMYSFVSTKE
jgi:arginine utilization protein RocB